MAKHSAAAGARATLLALCAASPKLVSAQDVSETAELLRETLAENKDLIAENLKLRDELATLMGRQTLLDNLTLQQEALIESEVTTEQGIVALAVAGALFLWALPLVILRRCCETRKHRVVPIISVLNLIIVGTTLWHMTLLEFNDLFFSGVYFIELLVQELMNVLLGATALFGLFIAWKFKDRIFDALGVENPELMTGQVRDWVTCWSMRRFHAVELFIWKVENLPPANALQSKGNVFCQVTLGYNSLMQTRVHHEVTSSCIFKESAQFNFDPFDRANNMTIRFRSQDMLGTTELCSVQLSANQINRLDVPGDGPRIIGWGSTTSATGGSSIWAPQRFEPIDLIPRGKVFLRFEPVVNEEDVHSSILCCCCPRRRRSHAGE